MAKSNLGRNSPTAQRRIEAKERALKALELRKKGMRYEEIAQRLGYSRRGNAHKAVMKELELLAKECLERPLLRLDPPLCGRGVPAEVALRHYSPPSAARVVSQW